ncbi:MAG: acyl-CoA thioesterase II [Myxococcota bacterium]
MSDSLKGLLQLLDLEDLEVNLFRGRSPASGGQRVFGGQVLAQALMAAGRTVEQGTAHSLHAYFVRPGDVRIPILYQVDRTRDGRSFTTRRVTAIQKGRAIFHLETSFHVDEDGPRHQVEMPDVPDPEGLPTWQERFAPLVEQLGDGASWFLGKGPIDIRHATAFDPMQPAERPPRLDVWIRADGQVPDDPILQRCLVAYASDMTLIDVAGMPHAMDALATGYQLASLDHAMWFHRDFRADSWLLYSQESPITSGARGFTTGRLFTQSGELVASVVQEGLLRPEKPAAERS